MIYLICEGQSEPVDVRVLDLILVNKLGVTVKIEPVGGDTSLKSVAQWIERTSKGHDKAYVIEDRNFRPLSDVEKMWQKPNQKYYIWRRHEIENYLLDPRIIAEAFKTISSNISKPLLTTEPEVLQLLGSLARHLLEDHAGRLTFQELQVQHNQLGTQLQGPKKQNLIAWSQNQEDYPDQQGWMTYFDQEYQRFNQACRNFIDAPEFTLSDIRNSYTDCLMEIQQPTFFSLQTFLQDLGGHELLSRLKQHLWTYGIHISLSDLVTELINALDRLYSPGFFVPDDFQELAARLK